MLTQWTRRWCLPSSTLIDSRSTTRSARSKCPSARSIWPKPSRSGENCRASRAKAVRYVIGSDSGSGSSTRLFSIFFCFFVLCSYRVVPRDYSEELAPQHTIPPTNSLEEHLKTVLLNGFKHYTQSYGFLPSSKICDEDHHSRYLEEPKQLNRRSKQVI